MPKVLLQRLAAAPDDLVQSTEGTIVFVDISGFTRLSERLARSGREGAEHLTDAINACFTALLSDAYAVGGGLLKFGGDALLLWFDGDDHAARACASACAMRATLRTVGRIRAGPSHIVLRMSVGIHSGAFETFLVGASHREYIIAGPGASTVVTMEAAASVGQILMSPATASQLPSRAVGSSCGPGLLLARSPGTRSWEADDAFERPADELITGCLSTAVRAHVLKGPAAPEHRTATVAFIQFGQLDELIAERGSGAAAEALDALVQTVQEATDLFQVCLLGSDVAAGGGKLILTAGAPRVVGDDEERMLLTLRHIVETNAALPIRVGVHRGQVFAGEIGPHYRRTYTVMGDAVNLAARLMAKAPWTSIYATRGVLARSQTKFAAVSVEPFVVKGKTKPVEAADVGGALRPSVVSVTTQVPLIGREAEYAQLRRAVEEAERHRGGLIEIVGETGSGKSRLLAEVRELGSRLDFVHTICESYRQSVPYSVWRDILRQVLGLHWEDPDDVVLGVIQSRIDAHAPGLRPWLPLLAIAIDVQVPMTPEVNDLAPEYRTAKLHEVVLEFLAPSLVAPTLVEIEHAHHMDGASAALVNALAEGLESSSWVVVVTRRDVTDGFVAAPQSATQLALGPLGAAAMQEIAEATPQAHVVPPNVLEMAVERASGSPEFLLDLLAAAVRGSGALPDSIEAAAAARLDELDPGDRLVVRRAAVLGVCFHRRRLRHVLEPGVAELDEEGWSRISRLFADDGDGYIRFTRPALREVAYEGLPFRLRRRLHAAVAEALEADREHDADADPAVLSLHFILARDHERAWRYAKAAADGAVAKFAQVDAAQLYRRAIEAGRPAGASDLQLAECWEALGEALQQSGDLSAAVDALTAARGLLRDDRLAQGRLFLRHVRIAHRRGRLAAAVRWGGRGLRVLGDAGDDSRVIRARLLAELAFIRYVQGRLIEAERLCRTVIDEFEADVEQRPLAHASYVLDLVLMDLGRVDEAVHCTRALEIYERLGDHEEQGHVLNALAMLAGVRWAWDEALSLYGRAAEAYARAGSQTGIAITACNIGEILSDRGINEQAAQQLRRARRIWSGNGERGAAAYAAALLGRISARRGDTDEARTLIGEAADDLRAVGEARYLEEADAMLAEAEALAGDASRALVLADALLSTSGRELSTWLQRVRGIALARLGQLDDAARELEESLATARQRGALYHVAAALSVLQTLGMASEEEAAERDLVLARLGIEQLPVLELVSTSRELAAAAIR